VGHGADPGYPPWKTLSDRFGNDAVRGGEKEGKKSRLDGFVGDCKQKIQRVLGAKEGPKASGKQYAITELRKTAKSPASEGEQK